MIYFMSFMEKAAVTVMRKEKRKLMGGELVREGIITPQQLKFALTAQRKFKGDEKERLGEILLKSGLIDEKTLTRFLEKYLGIPYAKVSRAENIDRQAAKLIPERMARYIKVIATGIDKKTNKLIVAMADPFDIIANQIDLPPTLINRFDLIFPIKDLPDGVKDEKLATHILGLHQNPDSKKPEIPTDMLKKYIAYARQFVHPHLTPEAIEEIKSFYLKMRMSGSEGGGVQTIPISPRQLEALVRLAEASARMRLSDVVLKRDAKKAIELLEYCLLQVGLDKETGKIDIDRIATGVGASQRNNILIVKEILNDLEARSGKTISIEDVVQEARTRGLDSEKVEEAIEKLRRTGDIFEPRRGFISKL